MIIRSLVEAMREQNWSSAALELLVVVLGVFLGLQVDAWNQARNDRADEAAYLERLHADTTFNLAQVKEKAQSYHDRASSLARIVEKLRAEEVNEIEIYDLTDAFCYWYVPEAVRLQSSTYDEMISTGGLELIRDRSILQNLQLSLAENDRLKEEAPKLFAVQMDLAKSLRKFTEWRFDAPIQIIDEQADGVSMRAGCVVDRVALTADPDISSILVQLNRSQTILGNQLLGEQRALDELLVFLEPKVTR